MNQIRHHRVHRARHGFDTWARLGAFAVNRDDFDHVLRFPVMGWPAYDVLYGIDGPGPQTDHGIFEANFRKLRGPHPFIRRTGGGPSSVALVAAGAARAPQY